jgi:dipeptidyl aminopeptidase/acylaminoacyl peptidase
MKNIDLNQGTIVRCGHLENLIANPKDVLFQSTDGTDVYGRLQRPNKTGPVPAVILIHGGMGNNKEFTTQLLSWPIADALKYNYVLFSSDYRLDLTGKDIEDIVAAFKFVSSLSFVDENKIAYFGDSHGCYLALIAALQTHPRAVVLNWGVADLAKWYNEIKDSPIHFYRELAIKLKRTFGGTPEDMPEVYRKVSPITHVHGIKCPVLINHGEDDDGVPVGHAYELARALESANCEYELKIYENAGHGLREKHANEAMCEITTRFLQKHM